MGASCRPDERPLASHVEGGYRLRAIQRSSLGHFRAQSIVT